MQRLMGVNAARLRGLERASRVKGEANYFSLPEPPPLESITSEKTARLSDLLSLRGDELDSFRPWSTSACQR